MPQTLIDDERGHIILDLESPPCPRVLVAGEFEAAEILEALPDGWTIHPDDFGNAVESRLVVTDQREFAYPLHKKSP
jgi:hypothetical protein